MKQTHSPQVLLHSWPNSWKEDSIGYWSTQEQVADIFIKSLKTKLFIKLKKNASNGFEDFDLQDNMDINQITEVFGGQTRFSHMEN